MIHEWHVVFLAGLTTGLCLRWAWAKAARVIRGPWLVLAATALGAQACAAPVVVIAGLRAATATAEAVHAAEAAKREIASATQQAMEILEADDAPAVDEEPVEELDVGEQQRRARAKADRDLAAFKARKVSR